MEKIKSSWIENPATWNMQIQEKNLLADIYLSGYGELTVNDKPRLLK